MAPLPTPLSEPVDAAAGRPFVARAGRWLARLREGASASACVVCERWQAQPLCPACRQRFGAPRSRCRLCALELPGAAAEICGACIRHPMPLQASVTAWSYAYPWDGLITRFKFHGAVDLAAPLADALAESVQDAWRAGWLEPPDLLLPVPLSPQRLRERGYNQAWELTRRLARRLHLPAHPQALQRLRERTPQAGLGRAQRLHNLAAAFVVAPAARPVLAGCRVALVDDVMTTGATLSEAAATLQRAGVAQVQAWVLARTPAT
ncbi:MAG: ComF family protein [Burkholderiaceae bacterium]|nr:ComF family protein [Burkholderiaceae bacterium]